MAKRFDICSVVGNTYERLTVIREGEPHKTSGGNTHRTIICKCSCGVEKSFQMSSVFNGSIKSCGCYSAYMSSIASTKRNTTHGLSKKPEYNVWLSMRKRCNNKSHKSYKHYGGRGINICERWNNSFINFYNDMGERPSKLFSIERTDNDGNYTPDNCIWATNHEQSRNNRNNVFITYNGETKCLTDWAKHLGFSPEKLRYRILVAKWDINKAFET